MNSTRAEFFLLGEVRHPSVRARHGRPEGRRRNRLLVCS